MISCMKIFDTSRTMVMRGLFLQDQWMLNISLTMYCHICASWELMRLKEKYGSSCMERFDTSKTTVMTKLSLEDQWIFYINSDNGLHILYSVYHLVLVLLRRAVCRRYWKWFFRCLKKSARKRGYINPFVVFLRNVGIFEHIVRNTCYLWYVLSLSFNPSYIYFMQLPLIFVD